MNAKDTITMRDLEERSYFTTPELAGLLGVSVGTIGQWAAKGKGPTYALVAGRRLFLKRAVSAWVDAQAGGVS